MTQADLDPGEIDEDALAAGYVLERLAHRIEEVVVDGVAYLRVLSEAEAAKHEGGWIPARSRCR